MRVLLDEQIPRGVKGLLPEHDVRTVQEQRWSSKENCELLTLASREFEVLVTADQNLPFQQNLKNFELGVVILIAPSNRIEAYEPLAVGLRSAVESVSQVKSYMSRHDSRRERTTLRAAPEAAPV